MTQLLGFKLIVGLLTGHELFAQDSPKHEFYGLSLTGFQDQGLGLKDAKKRQVYDGFAAGYVQRCTRLVGLKFEVSGLTDKQTVGSGANRFSFRQSNWWLMGGVQVKANPKDSRLRPFVHALGGATVFQTSTSAAEKVSCAANFGSSNCPNRFDRNTVWAAISLGAGLDIRIGQRWEFRVGQVEYMPMCRYGLVHHNVRVGMGVVFH
jgi:hypothetical protein